MLTFPTPLSSQGSLNLFEGDDSVREGPQQLFPREGHLSCGTFRERELLEELGI